MQRRGGEGQGSNREIRLRIAPWQAPQIYARIRPPKHTRWLAGVADRYLYGAAPKLSQSTTLSRSLMPLQCLTDVASCLSSPVDGDDTEAGQHVVLPLDRATASTARRDREERRVELEGWRGRGSGERQAGRWAGSRSIWGISEQCPYACVLFFERERISGWGWAASRRDGHPWSGIIEYKCNQSSQTNIFRWLIHKCSTS
jgi:hypothetical protein